MTGRVYLRGRSPDGRDAVPRTRWEWRLRSCPRRLRHPKPPARRLLRATIFYLPALFALMMINSRSSRLSNPVVAGLYRSSIGLLLQLQLQFSSPPASSFAIRNSRIWPGSQRLPASPSLSGAPLFHRACSIEPSDERSASRGDSAAAFVLLSPAPSFGNAAVAPESLPQVPRAAARTGNFNHAAGDDVAFFVLGEIFVESSRHELFHAQANVAFFRIDREHLRLARLARTSAPLADD